MTARQQIRVGPLRKDRAPIDTQRAPTVGEMLQAAREKKGVDLYRAERDTKIRARHLAALESGDYAELPASVYTKGFLRNYALYLALDPEELIERWRDEQDYARRGEPNAVTAPPQPIVEPRRGLTITPGILIAALLSVVVLLFAGYVGLQLIRFSTVPEVTVQGPQVVELGPQDQTWIIRGTAAPRAVVNVSGANGEVIKTTTADDAGAWVVELPVGKGRNDFTVTARDPDTGRESPELQLLATVPVPATPTPFAPEPTPGATPRAVTATGAAATPEAPATPTPMPTAAPPGETPAPATPAADPGTGVARLDLAEPTDGEAVENEPVAIEGTTDAAGAVVTATWVGPPGQDEPGGAPAPVAPDQLQLRVRGGAFSDVLLLPAGRWRITVDTVASDGLAAASSTRTVDVKHSGVWVVVEARQSAWIRVWVDGELAESGHTFRKGETASFSGRRSVVVSSGNAGGTWVVVNGASYGSIGTPGEVATWSFEKGKAPRALQ